MKSLSTELRVLIVSGRSADHGCIFILFFICLFICLIISMNPVRICKNGALSMWEADLHHGDKSHSIIRHLGIKKKKDE